MNTYPIYKKTAIIIVATYGLLFSSCKKFIEVDAPITSINKDNIYNTDNNAIAVLTGIYTKMSSTDFSLSQSLYPELSADNLSLFDLNNSYAKLYYVNDLLSTYPGSLVIQWNDLFSYIYYCNDAIEGITKSNSISTEIKNQLLGEAYFLRGFYYFYLVNLYGRPPLILTTDYSESSIQPNSSADQIYSQIILDLKQAEALLKENYIDGSLRKSTIERVRPNKFSASALLARVYLFTKNYKLADTESSKIIEFRSMYSLASISEAFLKNSSETIWALQPVTSNKNTAEGDFFIYNSTGPSTINYTYLSNSLINSFEKGDLRRTQWVGDFTTNSTTFFYPTKYKVKNGDPSTATEYAIVLRLAEQYLIRAEARIQLGNIKGGTEDLNVLRARSRASSTDEIPNPLPDLSVTITKTDALDALLRERRIELFTEWGHRWFDIKRLQKVDEIMTIETHNKGGNWKSYSSLYPIPISEMKNNPNINQNSGYK